MKRNGIRAILFVVPSLALFMGLVFTHPSIQIHADSSGSHHAVSVPQITCGQWNLIPNNSNNSVLEGVAAVSVNDAWAVGFTDVAGNINNRQPFTMHWDGNSWKSIASPTLAGTLNKLNGVAIIATNDVWAVGDGNSFGGQAFFEHWDGAQWNIVSQPAIATFHAGDFWGIGQVPNQTYIWAVGSYYATSNKMYHPLTVLYC